MKHNISGIILEQQDNCDCNKIIFIDTSKYQAEVTNPLLRIYPPNWDKYIDVQFNVSAITILEPKHIKHVTFPDGSYRIIQSVCPNEKTEVGFCYFHTCSLEETLCKMISENIDDEDKLEELFTQKMYLDSVKKLDPIKATEVYNNVANKLKNICNECM